MDKIAMYEEAILNSVFEKEAGAMSKFMRNIDEVERNTGLKAKLPRLEKAINEMHDRGLRSAEEYIRSLKNNAKGCFASPRNIIDERNVERMKGSLGWKPYKKNTGLTGNRTERINDALRRNKQLRFAKQQKEKYPNIKGVLFN